VSGQHKYRAFISYSHADEQWAKWLHKSLETYQVPRRLVGTATPIGPVPAKFSPVFRDRDELATSTSLGDTLTRALEQSAFQVVICSMAAARSRWVNEEILAFKRLGREDRIFCLVVDGEPGASTATGRGQDECFPHALIYRMGADGQLTDRRIEPVAADARPGRDGRNDAKLKLIAGMLGVGLDDLKQREIQRRNRRLAMLAAASVVGMAMTSLLATTAFLARNEAQRQRVRAEVEAETARKTMELMADLFDRSATQVTLQDSMGAVCTSLGFLDPSTLQGGAGLVVKAYPLAAGVHGLPRSSRLDPEARALARMTLRVPAPGAN
jgi:hypothetical protein